VQPPRANNKEDPESEHWSQASRLAIIKSVTKFLAWYSLHILETCSVISMLKADQTAVERLKLRLEEMVS
jgi:hypothetical protein